VLDLKGIDPDDAFSIVPYEKGNAFLMYLEQKLGGPGNCCSYMKRFNHSVLWIV